MSSSRREFLTTAGKLVVAVPAGWVLLQAGCGGSGAENCDNANGVVVTATEVTVTSQCASGHVHAFDITTQELASPPQSGISGPTTESDGHTHTVSLTQSELQNIQAGTPVNKITNNVNGHTHVFNFRKSS
jgi:hypothetical protein